MTGSRNPQHVTHSLRRYQKRLLLLFSLGWLVIKMGRHAIPPLLPTIIAELSISSFEAGFGLTLMWASYALVQYPSGEISDRTSYKTVIILGLCVVIVGFGILSVIRSYVWFVIGVMCLGMGSGIYLIPSRAQIAELFSDRQGRALGINQSAGMGGSALATALVVSVLGVATWRATFVPVIAGLVLITVGIHVLERTQYKFTIAVPRAGSTVRWLLASPRIRWLILIYSLYTFAFEAILGFLPIFLQVNKEFSPLMANAGFALVYVTGIVVMPISGEFSDRTPFVSLIIVALGLGVVGVVGLLSSLSAGLVFVSIFLFAVGMMSFSPVMESHVLDQMSDEQIGKRFGLFRTIYMLVGSTGPVYVGFIAEYDSYSTAYVGVAICLFTAIGSLLWLTVSGATAR